MRHTEIFLGEPDFEAFVFRAFAGVSSTDGEVTMAFKTYGPSLEITMTRSQARLFAIQLIVAASGMAPVRGAPREPDPLPPMSTVPAT